MENTVKLDELFDDIPTLDTPRLQLRKIHPVRFDEIFAPRPDRAALLLSQLYRSYQMARTTILALIESYSRHQLQPWGIYPAGSDEAIGACSILYWSLQHNRAEIGVALRPEHRRETYAAEAARRMIEFGFEVMDLNRIEAQSLIDDETASQAYGAAGMEVEGVQRGVMNLEGEFVDLKLHAIVRADY